MITDQKRRCRTRVKPLKRARYLRSLAEEVRQVVRDLDSLTPPWPAFRQQRPERPKRPEKNAPLLALHAWNGGLRLIRQASHQAGQAAD